MSRKVKIWVLVSALWVFGWLVSYIDGFPSYADKAGFMVFSFGPLLLGWGIWWVLKSDK